jgi:type IV pilus assembly protein PilC
MPTTMYDYKVRDRDGKLIKSQIEAGSVSLVANKLREMGYTPIDIKPVGGASLRRDINIPGLTDRVNLKSISIMSRQLATMVASGLTLVRALSVLTDQVDSKPLRAILTTVRQDVEQGSSLSVALDRHPKVFGPLYISMVRAGEAGGQLDTVLMRLSTTIEKQVELRSKVKSAMTYPTVVLCAVILIVTLMMILVVPTFKHLFSTLKGTLPLPTRIVIGISNVLASWRLIVVIIVVALATFLFRKWIQTDQGREIWDRFKLRPPIFGALIHKICLARFASTLASLVSAGVPIIESLEIVGANVGNILMSKAVRGSINGVREGRALSSCLTDYEIIPVMVTQMIETGEESGALDTMLEKIASFYDNEVSATVSSLTSLLEPLIILFMGACIGAIVISLYLPMFDYVKLINNSGGG